MEHEAKIFPEAKNFLEAKNILFVEDEPLLGELMVDALGEKGFAVTVVPDARGALRYLLSGAQADVLFTDIDLGAGMDGAALAQIVHQMRPRLPIVYTSGRRFEFDKVPGAAFLPKPYTVDRVGASMLVTGVSRRSSTSFHSPPSFTFRVLLNTKA